MGYKMRLLELFSGSGSVGRIFEKANWDVVSIDINPKFNPTICCSILDLAIDKWEPGHFDYIHASPPCCEYSQAHTGNARNLERGDMLAIYSLHLIDALRPRWFTLENRQSGKLKTRPFMQALPYADAAYCMYSEWGYKKLTRIWHNIPGLTLEVCNGHCSNMAYNGNGRLVHRCSAQKGPSRGTAQDRCFTSEELYRIPPALVETILHAINAAM